MKEITNAFIGYFKQQPDWKITSYLFVFSLMLLFFGTFVLLKFFNKKESPFLKLKYSIFGATNISLFFLVAFTVYFTYFNSYIYKQHLQPIIILLIAGHLLILIYLLKNLFKAIKSNSLKSIGVVVGPIIQKEKSLAIILSVRKLKSLVFLSLLPFVLLIFKPKETYLYSIVFDNSASMEEQLTYAKNALKEVVNNLNSNSSFVISNVPICNSEASCIEAQLKAKKNLNTIVNVGDTGSLLASTSSFNTKEEFFSFINSGGIETTRAGSSIYECIWQNFIESVKFNETNPFTKKRLIVLTDGNDNLYVKEAGFVAPINCISDFNYKNTLLNEFYSGTTFISYGDASVSNIFKTCNNIEVLNGFDYTSFKNSFYEQLQDIFFDKQLLWIIALFLLLGIFIIFTIK